MTFLGLGVTSQTLSLPFFLVIVIVVIVVGGIAAYFLLEKRLKNSATEAPSHVAQMGYGRERWERELTLWKGILRRLEIQAKYQTPVSERLQKEIAEAEAKIAEAEAAIKKG